MGPIDRVWFLGLVIGILMDSCVVDTWKVVNKRGEYRRVPLGRRSTGAAYSAHDGSYTVYGLCSAIPDGGCGVAVTRISGRQSLQMLELLTTRESVKHRDGAFQCSDRVATLRNIYSHSQEEPIDKAITIYFKAPRSFTGEDVVEIHTHGSKAIVTHMFEALRQLSGREGIFLRQAERGEFTRRAFYNGKLDLTQAEALRDVIGAETRLHMQNATIKLHGGLSRLYRSWAERLRRVLAFVEAKIDFEEQASTDINIANHEIEALKEDLSSLSKEITEKMEDAKGELLSSAVNVALVGPPNAGKSTLLNAICDRDVAIVASVPGTTRDIIQVPYDLYGTKLSILDTAGIRNLVQKDNTESHLIIEKEGIDRALKGIGDVTVAVFLYDHINPEGSEEALGIVKECLPQGADLILCIAKSDLLDDGKISEVMENIRARHPDLVGHICLLSGFQQNSVDNLMKFINNKVGNKLPVIKNEPLITDSRHKSHLRSVMREIGHAMTIMEGRQKELEIIAENMREALTQMAYIVGEQTNEQVLDDIFNTFCIGK